MYKTGQNSEMKFSRSVAELKRLNRKRSVDTREELYKFSFNQKDSPLLKINRNNGKEY